MSERFIHSVTASAVCTPVDSGPESLDFALFTTKSAMDEVMDLLAREAQENGVSCRRDYSVERVPWVDGEGKVRGEMSCSDVHIGEGRTHIT